MELRGSSEADVVPDVEVEDEDPGELLLKKGAACCLEVLRV